MPLGPGVGGGGTGLCAEGAGPSAFNFIDRMTWQMQVTDPATETSSCWVHVHEDVTFEDLQAFIVNADSADLIVQVYRSTDNGATEATFGGLLTIPAGTTFSNKLTGLANPREDDLFRFQVTQASDGTLLTVAMDAYTERG